MKEVIEYGTLIKRNGEYKDTVAYKMIFLDETYLEEILDLQEKVFKTLDNLETFVPDTKEFMEKSIFPPDQGRVIGVFTNEGLIAYRTINFPGKDEKNLGREINLIGNDLDKVAHLESTVVHPLYRGNRLQAKMLPHSIKLIRELGYEFVLTTISPYNYPSLKNVMDQGLTIKNLKIRNNEYKGKLRYLLSIDFINTNKEITDIIIVKNTDLLKQQELLAEGYEGYQIEKREGYFDVMYCKYK